ncbi:MAG: GNAT family N-acetyltransferase [Alphaproteobacteria bacterium]|nr:GNAT family N-acetyltransferase [Alphaproteobacteria bacterium]
MTRTTSRLNALGQPIGDPLPEGWAPPGRPPRDAMEGHWVRLEPADSHRHAEGLFAANGTAETDANWTYLAYGPFAELVDYRAWFESIESGDDPLFFVLIDKTTGKPVGIASYLRIDPKAGVMEVGHINLSPLAQRTPLSTEAMYLMMKRAFDLGYRRYEWKCDAVNAPSMKAAERLGFTYEGTFRQATHYKGRNRDTAWFSVLDSEWPALRDAFEAWLDPANFDADGRQRRSLAALRGDR